MPRQVARHEHALPLVVRFDHGALDGRRKMPQTDQICIEPMPAKKEAKLLLKRVNEGQRLTIGNVEVHIRDGIVEHAEIILSVQWPDEDSPRSFIISQSLWLDIQGRQLIELDVIEYERARDVFVGVPLSRPPRHKEGGTEIHLIFDAPREVEISA